MRRLPILFSFFFTLFFAILLCGCAKKPSLSGPHLALRNGATLALHSLDPSYPPPAGNALFYRWSDLGAVDISAAADRKRILDALDASIAGNNGSAAACFEPRHALRTTYQGKTYDAVICFECLHAVWYIDEVREGSFPLSPETQAMFDATLRTAGVALAPAPP